MRTISSFLLLIILYLFLCTEVSPQAAQTAQPKGAINGHVFADDTGQPVKGALVFLLMPGSQQPAALTDLNGAYEFRDLAPGAYDVQASRRGFITLTYAEMSPAQLVLRAGEQRQGVDLRLKRAGVITGTVTDEDGEPLSDIVVSAVAEEARGLRVGYTIRRETRTNDRGAYRITDLVPGRYFVRANYQDGRELFGYGLTLHPDTPSLQGARPVLIGRSGRASGVNIRLEPQKLFKISGMAFDAAGGGLAGASVEAVPANRDLRLTATARGRTNADGTFELSLLPEGSYQVLVSPNGPYRPAVARATVALAGKNVDRLTVMAAAPITVVGAVRAEGARLPAKASMQVALVDRSQAERDDVFAGSVTCTGASPQFNIEDVQPGDYQLEFDIGDTGPERFYVREIRLNGQDVTDKLLAIPPGSPARVEIVLDSRGGGLGGLLRDDQDRPTRGWIFPEATDPPRRATGRYRQLETVADDGRYEFRGLPPGDYVAIAWRSRLYLPSPELFAQLEPYGTAVRVEKESAVRLDMRIRPEIEKLLNLEQ